MLALLAVALGALAVFYAILNLNIPGLWKFGLSVLEMVIVSQIFVRVFKMSGEAGLVLLRSKHGLELINRMAKNADLLKFLSDMGTTMAYGLLSIPLMGKNTSPKSVIAGLVAILIISYVVAPNVFPFLTEVLNLSSLEKARSQISVAEDGGNIILLAGLAILIAGGFFFVMLASIVGYGAFIIYSLVNTFTSGQGSIPSPGGTFLLPGINLPFFEGIAALFIILAVHEVAHAVLARVGKVPVLSSGIVLFGILPVGAFVEPDEKALAKMNKVTQTRVLVAGSSSNLMFAILFFALFSVFFVASAGFRDTGLLVTASNSSDIFPDTIIHGINGTLIDPLDYSNVTLSKNATVLLNTNIGNITARTNAEGGLGVLVAPITKDTLLARFTIPGIGFIYMVLGLCFALNFVVGTVNLLPLPFFDGYRALDINIKNKMVVKGLMVIALLSFLMNFVPWLFAK